MKKKFLALCFAVSVFLTGCGRGNNRTGEGAAAPASETAVTAAQDLVTDETVSSEEEMLSEEAISGEGMRAAQETETEPFIVLTIDGEESGFGSVAQDSDDPLRVYITWNGYILLDLPFGEPHEVIVHQRGGEENVIQLTGEEVFMEDANCDGQDCVQMGSVTRENLELRVLGGFIVCLPNRITVEVRDSR